MRPLSTSSVDDPAVPLPSLAAPSTWLLFSLFTSARTESCERWVDASAKWRHQRGGEAGSEKKQRGTVHTFCKDVDSLYLSSPTTTSARSQFLAFEILSLKKDRGCEQSTIDGRESWTGHRILVREQSKARKQGKGHVRERSGRYWWQGNSRSIPPRPSGVSLENNQSPFTRDLPISSSPSPHSPIPYMFNFGNDETIFLFFANPMMKN